MEEILLTNTENISTVIDYSNQLNQLIDISNNILAVNFVFLNFFVLFCICSLIYLFFKNF